MSTYRKLAFIFGSALIAALVPIHPAPAQTINAAAAPNLAADALRDSAAALYEVPTNAVTAAKLHVREAALRTQSDPEAVKALMTAARLFYFGKQPEKARVTMLRGAERALTLGDVLAAAQAYTDAAFLASAPERGDLARKAALLSQSPLLTTIQRFSITHRLGGDREIARLVDRVAARQ